MPHGLRPMITPGSLSRVLSGQNSRGETKLDSSYQEAHPGEPPCHHPPEGEFRGHPHLQLLMGGRERGRPSEPAVGVHWGFDLWMSTPLDCGSQFSGCHRPQHSTVGHPGAARMSLWVEGCMAHGKVVTGWVSFPSRPRRPSWKWIPIVSVPFLPALSLIMHFSRSGCILGKLCLTFIFQGAGRMGRLLLSRPGGAVYCETRDAVLLTWALLVPNAPRWNGR